MSQCTLGALVPVLSNSSVFSQQGVNYALKSYLSLSNEYATIDRSVTLENHHYHLISLHNSQSQSYLLTAVKIASYLTVILPVLAMIMVMITDGNNHYYDNNYYIDDFKNMLRCHPKEATALTLLDPLVLYKKRLSGESTIIEIFRSGYSQERRTIIQLINNYIKEEQNYQGIELAKEDKKTLFDIAINSYFFYDDMLDMIKALNIATKGALHQDLTQCYLNTIRQKNFNLWTYLTSTTNPFPVNPSSIKVDLDEFYDKLEYPTIYQDQLAAAYNADPSVLTREDSQGRTMFMRLLKNPSYFSKKSVDWIIKTDFKSILTVKNTTALFERASDDCGFNDTIKTLNEASNGAIHKNLTKDNLSTMFKKNYDLWIYLTSKTNKFRVQSELVEVDLDDFYEKLKHPTIYQDKLDAAYNADPSVLTREDSQGRTMFRRLLKNYSYFSKKSVDWIIKTDFKSILTVKNTTALFEYASEKHSSITRVMLYDNIKTLNKASKGAIHKDLTQNCVDKIYTNNRELWDYLTNADGTNPRHPIHPNLRTPPTSSSSDHFDSSSKSSSSSSSSSSGRSSGSRRSPPPQASLSTPTYRSYLDTLYTLSGIKEVDYPITSKSELKKLYLGAIVKLHPDKNNSNSNSIRDMPLFNAAYTNIQQTKEYQNLPD